MAIQLEDFLFPKPEDADDEQFKVDTPEKADWALRKYAQAKRAIDEYTRQRDDMIARANEWLAEVSKPYLETMHRMEALLQQYHREQLQKNPKAKTIKRPVGVLKSVTRNKWHYREDDLLKWLKQNRPDLVRIKEEPNKQQLKKVSKINGEWVYTEDGERIEGVMVMPTTEFKIEVE
jgi:hypothetical protein